MAGRLVQRGFTMVELVIVMILLGIVSVFVLPKMQAAVSFQDEGWRDQVIGALRYGQKTAVSHRRLVCVTIGTTSVTLNIASANPATACNSALQGPGGSNIFGSTTSAAATAVSPAGTIFLQPDGRATTDGAGTTAATRTISMTGAANVVLYGATGFAE